jgi:hypothetical protein
VQDIEARTIERNLVQLRGCQELLLHRFVIQRQFAVYRLALRLTCTPSKPTALSQGNGFYLPVRCRFQSVTPILSARLGLMLAGMPQCSTTAIQERSP